MPRIFAALFLFAGAALATAPVHKDPSAKTGAARALFLEAREKELAGEDAAALDLYRRAYRHDAASRDLCFLYLNRLKAAGSIDSAAALGDKCAGLAGTPLAAEYKTLGEVALRADNEAAALRWYREAYRLNDADGDVLYVLAGLYEDARDWEGYVDVTVRLLPILQYPPRLMDRQLQAYARLNRPDSVLPLLREAWNATGLPAYGQALAGYYDARGLYLSLLGVARKLAESAPAPAHDLLLARSYAVCDRPDSALAVYEKLLKANPADPDLLDAKASLLFDRGRYKEAHAIAVKLAKADPAEPAFAALLGSASLELRKSGARESLQRAADLAPRSPDYRARLGYADHALRHPERADGDLAIAPDSLGPEIALLFEGLAHAQLARLLTPREPGERPAIFSDTVAARRHRLAAAGLFEKVLAGNSANRSAAFELAVQRERLGEREVAKTILRRIVAKDTANATALNYLGYMLIEDSTSTEADRHEAGVLLERAVSLEPENGAYLDSKGWWLYREGRFDSARIYLERAAEAIPSDPSILAHLAEALHAQGRGSEACALWAKVRRDGGRALPKECR